MKKMKMILIISVFFTIWTNSAQAENEIYEFIRNLKQNESKNITQEYANLPSIEIQNLEKNQDLKKIKIIFLPGFLSKEIQKFYDYFNDQMKYLNEIGIENESLKIKSADGIQTNSKIIIDAIKKEKKSVIIISHSKGGLDFLHALVRSSEENDMEWTKKVKGWVAIQSPFFGSPVADDFNKIKFISSSVLNLLGGEYQALADLMVYHRRNYMGRNNLVIDFWLKKIPTITLATYVEMPKVKDAFQLFFLGGQNTILSSLRDFYDKKKILIDGLNPYNSAILPKTDYILFTNVDHLSPVSKNAYNRFDRIDFTKRVLILLLKKIHGIRPQ